MLFMFQMAGGPGGMARPPNAMGGPPGFMAPGHGGGMDPGKY